MQSYVRLFDTIVILIAGRLLQTSYSRIGYAPIATQFSLVMACHAAGAVAGCYLVSRWILPDALTGLLFLVGAANTFRITTWASPYKRLWTSEMYERDIVIALNRFRGRMRERLLALVAAVVSLGLLAAATAYGDVSDVAMMVGLTALALSSTIHGYLRAAPPPKPKRAGKQTVTDRG
jgi:hypothetical protein